ncbi:unnamed protein product [Orchesella dallaii]|uniref:MAGE domain-containing protein n=1 Tax=Orchesella dallaii TaxID=48710 RepID=A0ABP1QVL3_9HEXA
MAPMRGDTKPKTGNSVVSGRRRVLTVQSDSSDSDGESPQRKAFEFPQPGTPPSTAQRNARSQRSQNQKSQSRKRNVEEDDEDCFSVSYDFETARELTEKEMTSNILLYIWIQQGKMRPIRKADLIKHAINKQSKDFPEAITQAKEALDKAFGLKLIGMKNGGTNDSFVGCRVLEATHFIIISKIRQLVAASVKPEDSMSNGLVKAGLLLILACTYMLDRSLDEDTIWSMFETMKFTDQICKKKEDLRRYLKTEYVDSLYLTKCEMKDTTEGVTRYGWGFRAEQEFNKFAVLKFVSETLSKTPDDFPTHFSKFSLKEIELVNEQDDLNNATNEDSKSGNSSEEDVSRLQEVEKSQSSPTRNQNRIDDDEKDSTGAEDEFNDDNNT